MKRIGVVFIALGLLGFVLAVGSLICPTQARNSQGQDPVRGIHGTYLDSDGVNAGWYANNELRFLSLVGGLISICIGKYFCDVEKSKKA